MNTKSIFTTCLMLFGMMALQAQVRFLSDNGKFGFKDQDGKVVIEPIYENAGTTFSGRYVNVKLNEKWGFINNKGETFVEPKYESASPFSGGLGGFAIVKLNGKYGFIDWTGKEIVPLEYDAVEPFMEELAAVNIGSTGGITGKGGKWGFVDTTGELVIPIQYDEIGNFLSRGFSNGKVKVKKDGREFYIDKTGKEVK